eukprot:TRINITY_DN451_c0_g1_i1.p1 TRINITY_DN451_c0_g1~~TRINITY_DN451_c0_g1_i1.p1  ORF type:complete len:213 (+),score=27.59 TRINITY_DN451_c0_g1_i1:292-930(+)
MMELCWKCNIKSSRVEYLWQKLLSPIASRAVPRSQIKALRIALMLDPLNYELPADQILSRLRTSLKMFHPSTIANIVSLLTNKPQFHHHPFFTHPRQSILEYFTFPDSVGRLSNKERVNVLANILHIYLPKEVERVPPIMFDPPPQAFMPPDIISNLKSAINTISSELYIDTSVESQDVQRLLVHLSIFRIQKRKKYRLRGRSSETAKAHRG